jgi:glycosyltransferase involved in cell wall biosynthesis
MHLFSRHGNTVLFVEGRQHLRSTLAAWRSRTIGPDDFKQPLLQMPHPNLFVFRYPVWTPISGQLPLGWATKRFRSLLLRKTLRQLQMNRPIVWFSQPGMGDLVNELPSARLRLYHVVDEYSSYPGQSTAHREQLRRLEKELIKQVDAVIVVSEKLYEAKRQYHDSIYIVPNGVDYEAYSQALENPQLPEDLECIPKPRIGYSGLVGDKLDMSILRELAVAKPGWSLVFVGEARVSEQKDAWQALLELPNVYYLGPKPVSQVPEYLKGFQVGVMPFVRNRQTENASPLKLYDYLAAGLASVSVDIPAVEEFRQYIHVANSPSDFTKAVEAALADDGVDHFEMRRAVAAQHTWEARAQTLSDIIQQLGDTQSNGQAISHLI